mgnify:CR=1 FL=1
MKVIKKFTKVLLVILILLISLFLIYWFGLRGLFAKSSLKGTLNAMTTGDYTGDFYYANSNGAIQKYLDTSELGYLTLTKSTFEVEECNLSWNSFEATATINVSYPNVYQLFNELYATADTVNTSEEINKTLIDALNNESDIDYCEETIEVTIVQYGTKWYLIENEALMDVYSGGLYSEYKNALSEMLAE